MAGLQVGEGELDLAFNAQFSLCLSTGPYCQVKSQSSQPLFFFVPGPAVFLRVGLVTETMSWMSWEAAAAPNESSPLARRVSRLRFLWRGLKVSF